MVRWSPWLGLSSPSPAQERGQPRAVCPRPRPHPAQPPGARGRGREAAAGAAGGAGQPDGGVRVHRHDEAAHRGLRRHRVLLPGLHDAPLRPRAEGAVRRVPRGGGAAAAGRGAHHLQATRTLPTRQVPHWRPALADQPLDNALNFPDLPAVPSNQTGGGQQQGAEKTTDIVGVAAAVAGAVLSASCTIIVK